MQYKPSQWVPGYKHSPSSAYTQINRMGLFLNVSTEKFETIDSTWDNLHSGGMFISGTNKIYFRDETNKDIYINSNADNEITIAATSGVTISGGNLIIGTAGKGIDFSIQTATATGTTTSELLDHYEEGTWTPTFTGNITGTLAGYYTRIGDTVNAWFDCASLDWSGSGGAYMTMSGFPFTSNANGLGYYPLAWDNLNITGTGSMFTYLPASATGILLIESLDASAAVHIQESYFSTSSATYLRGVITYRV